MTQQDTSIRASKYAYDIFTSYLYFYNQKNQGKKKTKKDLLEEYAKTLSKSKVMSD